ncbi:carboxypeptidase-like regulatory domain-containing protein [Sphingobacterium phlebotomi]|uniref:Carboxypeptidase-like regulatory domain-containing protein n=1 Tax=Sphingobacterium phlebotomi TaxID=2605433 RepID=A0A5D4H7Z8_9SPHI|nr:carboxypeptidase-like regulatory domain-containing protein [Sphingobacterium phlebotomi]TYR36808.1 carboxypeptidase-like regulatory domain-containing protein [Sphingobacterium phlebotomi]
MAGRFYYIFILIFLLSWVTLSAQERKIVQFSGLISSVGGELPVPFVTVTNISYNSQVHAANNEGFFSFVAHVGDTIRFTSVGFEPAEFVIPETALDKFTAKINMKSLVIELPAVMPFPWASIEEFNMAFMALDVSDDNISRIRNSLSPEALAALSQVVPRSAEEIQTFNSMQRHINMSNKTINQRFANPLFSPFAWGSFINSIVKGDYSRKRLEY